MDTLGGTPPPGRQDLVIAIARELRSLYEFLKSRQESGDGTLAVHLDRRLGDRRQASQPVMPDRRRATRRAQPAAAARALMAVLGFAVLHRQGERYVP